MLTQCARVADVHAHKISDYVPWDPVLFAEVVPKKESRDVRAAAREEAVVDDADLLVEGVGVQIRAGTCGT